MRPVVDDSFCVVQMCQRQAGRKGLKAAARGGKMKLFRHAFLGLLLGCGLLAFGSALSGCPSDSLCEQACKNNAAKCGTGTSSSISSSFSSSGTADCVHMCENGLGSKSGSSGAAYKDMLACVANAKSCLEIQSVCSP
jgi:hypothetical protein